MQSKKIVASVACAVAAMSALSAQAIEIYPVDHARFMTNARLILKLNSTMSPPEIRSRLKSTERISIRPCRAKNCGWIKKKGSMPRH